MENFFLFLLLGGSALIFCLVWTSRNAALRELQKHQKEYDDLAILLGQKTVDISVLQSTIRTYQNTIRENELEKTQLHLEIRQLKNKLFGKQMHDSDPFAQTFDNSDNVLKGLSQEELKKLRFLVHPDKNDGKTHDLFIKINGMIK